jgi:hypothetical protein
MVEDNVLEQRLWSVAEREAVQRSIKITPDGAGYLKSFIHDGVRKLIAEGKVNDQSIELAEANLIKFMTKTSALTKKLSEDKMRLGVSASPELNKRTVMQSKLSICPCWPFC